MLEGFLGRLCESGGTGRRARLRGVWIHRTGSSPVSRTNSHWIQWLFIYADMAELVDALVSGSSERSCRFKSCYPHQSRASTRICAVGAFTFVEQNARVDMQCVINIHTTGSAGSRLSGVVTAVFLFITRGWGFVSPFVPVCVFVRTFTLFCFFAIDPIRSNLIKRIDNFPILIYN